MAGINAHLKCMKKPLILRDGLHWGLIDDLITKGTEEPYQCFYFASGYRTLLRQDTDFRLTPKGMKWELCDVVWSIN
jgi:tRNA U34 5-carboxymethylaminomethyl modifying enzyme MnmG/GidA